VAIAPGGVNHFAIGETLATHNFFQAVINIQPKIYNRVWYSFEASDPLKNAHQRFC
jgi:hypothetical protein